jgi:hypothetical protein
MEFDGENLVNSVDELMSDTTKLKIIAKGDAKPTLKEFVESKKKKDAAKRLNENPVEQAEYLDTKYGPAPDEDPNVLASGGLARLGYQMGGDVAYDATDSSIYGSSAITVTPDTVMGSGGNQIQDKMGKPEQGGITNAQDTTLSVLPALNLQTVPMSPGRPGAEPEQLTGDALVNQIQMRMQQQDVKPDYWNAYASDVLRTGGNPTKTLQQYQKEIGAGKLELDLPNLGGNNNQMGILPVMPNKPTNMRYIDPGPGIGAGEISEYYTGKDYGPGNQPYAAVMPQPGMRYVYDEKGTRYSVPIEDYEGPTSGMPLTQELKSQQLAANYGDSPLASTVRTSMFRGGIARMLGE